MLHQRLATSLHFCAHSNTLALKANAHIIPYRFFTRHCNKINTITEKNLLSKLYLSTNINDASDEKITNKFERASENNANGDKEMRDNRGNQCSNQKYEASSDREEMINDTNSEFSASSGDCNIVERHRGFIQPSNDIVLETARKALARENRDEEPRASIWKWDTTTMPILAQNRQNAFDFTDDIPSHVKPMWEHEYYQQREYFRAQREKRPLKERIRFWAIIAVVLTFTGTVLVFFRVWIEQPREIRTLREEILQNTYGRVLELAAGHGQNIGAYPYAVHEVVLTDSNPLQLQALRYRIPHTAYPKYDVQRVRSEALENFKDGEFDCVVDMFGLCQLHDPVMALRQMQRVVKPSGMILLLEHGASPYPPVNWFLNYFEERHRVNTHGCKWNLPIREFLSESRLEIKELRNLHYGTTYYIVAYPEVLDAYQSRNQHSSQLDQEKNANTKSQYAALEAQVEVQPNKFVKSIQEINQKVE